jgi:hypothetical protein
MKASIKNQIADAMNSGKFVAGTYLKKNGEVTKFHGRAGVHKHTKGGVSCLNPNNFLIWDIKRERYMALIPDNVLTLTASNNLYETI